MILRTEQVESETGEIRNKSALQRIKGDLYLLGEDKIAAEEGYLNAIAAAQKQSAKLLELESVKRLARLWQRQGITRQAREKREEVYAWFTEGFDTPLLIEAKALLKVLAS